jgi:hypothetical protein
MPYRTRHSQNRRQARKSATLSAVDDIRIPGTEINSPHQFVKVLEATAKLGRNVLRTKKIKRHGDQSKTISALRNADQTFNLEYSALSNYVLDRQLKSTSAFLEKPQRKPGMPSAKYHFVSYGQHLAKMRPICPDLSDQLYAVMEDVTISRGFGAWGAENNGRGVTLFTH